jgi:uncharacterized phage-associated protein
MSTQASAALRLASWILRSYPYTDAITHLKLQKLVFYSYGFGAARGFQPELGTVVFEPWEHGPVSRAVWDDYKSFGGAPIPRPSDETAPVRYSPDAENVLGSVLRVYGLLNAWSIREQTHTEAPWQDAFKAHAGQIEDATIVAHFRTKLSSRFQLPELLFDRGSYSLDGTPSADLCFTSLEAAASALARILPHAQ